MKNKKRILGIVLTGIFILLIVLVLSGNTFLVDDVVYKISRTEVGTNVMKGITLMGEYFMITFLAVLGLIFMRDKRDILFVGGVTLLTAILNSGVKILFKRARPVGIALIEETSYSFPSGHSLASMVFYGMIIYLIYRSNFNKKVKIATMGILGVLIFLVGLSRVYLGVHYISDVIGGFIFGGIFLVASTSIYDKKISKDRIK